MAKFDITKYTTEQLIEIHALLEKELTFCKALGEFLSANNATFEDLSFNTAKKRGRGRPAAKAVAVAGKRGKVAPKWRHKDDSSLTWSGRGRTPKWIKKFGVKV